jgi:hypothetical protein
MTAQTMTEGPRSFAEGPQESKTHLPKMSLLERDIGDGTEDRVSAVRGPSMVFTTLFRLVIGPNAIFTILSRLVMGRSAAFINLYRLVIGTTSGMQWEGSLPPMFFSPRKNIFCYSFETDK